MHLNIYVIRLIKRLQIFTVKIKWSHVPRRNHVVSSGIKRHGPHCGCVPTENKIRKCKNKIQYTVKTRSTNLNRRITF